MSDNRDCSVDTNINVHSSVNINTSINFDTSIDTNYVNSLSDKEFGRYLQDRMVVGYKGPQGKNNLYPIDNIEHVSDRPLISKKSIDLKRKIDSIY